MLLRRKGSSLVVKVRAGHSYAGRFVVLQVQRHGRWVGVQRIELQRHSRARFTPAVHHVPCPDRRRARAGLPGRPQRLAEAAVSGEIFVVGASRSGTNLVRALLNAHSTLWISGETHYFDDLRPRLPGNGTEPLAGDDRERCERYFLALSHRAFGQAGDPDESRFDRDELRALAA